MKISGTLISKLKMIRSELACSDLLDESGLQMSPEGHSSGHFTCPLHTGYKVAVLFPKEGFTRPLLCVKCLIDPEIERQLKGENLIALNDLIHRSSTSNHSNVNVQLAKEKLEKKYSEFKSRDYLGVYDRHVEMQMRKLDREIEKFKEVLEELRFQISQVYEGHSKNLRAQEEHLTRKITEYIDEQDEIENLGKSTQEDINEAIRRMDDIKEYEMLMKALYRRSSFSQSGFENLALKSIVSFIDDLKDRVNSMKNFRIDTTKMEGKLLSLIFCFKKLLYRTKRQIRF